jgi:hypothetical protein
MQVCYDLPHVFPLPPFALDIFDILGSFLSFVDVNFAESIAGLDIFIHRKGGNSGPTPSEAANNFLAAGRGLSSR